MSALACIFVIYVHIFNKNIYILAICKCWSNFWSSSSHNALYTSWYFLQIMEVRKVYSEPPPYDCHICMKSSLFHARNIPKVLDIACRGATLIGRNYYFFIFLWCWSHQSSNPGLENDITQSIGNYCATRLLRSPRPNKRSVKNEIPLENGSNTRSFYLEDTSSACKHWVRINFRFFALLHRPSFLINCSMLTCLFLTIGAWLFSYFRRAVGCLNIASISTDLLSSMASMGFVEVVLIVSST